MKYTLQYLISKGFFDNRHISMKTSSDNVQTGTEQAKNDASSKYPDYQFIKVESILLI